MSTALIQAPERERFIGELMSPQALTARLNLIQSTMAMNMEAGTDYGKIPGTQKPTLLKPGAEKLCATFGIAPDYETEDLSTHDCIRVRVKCVGKQQGTEVVLGSGVGECSSDETKYKWRSPVCRQEFEETPADRRREKWMRGREGPYKAQQIRTEVADVANTILKMAAKRAHVAMALNVTGASAIFGQDVEDMPEELRPAAQETQRRPARRTPQAKPDAPTVVTEAQLKILRSKMADAGMSEDQLCARFQTDSIELIQFNDVNAALAFIADPQRDEVQP